MSSRRIWLLLLAVVGIGAALGWYWLSNHGDGFPKPRPTNAAGGITAVPLRRPAPLDEALDGPRFVRLAAAECGLDFSNVLRKENAYQYLTNGAGLAVADYDADGLVDVYLISQDGKNKLFRQTAPLRFVDVTASAGGLGGGDAWGTGASFADVDGDGDLDLYVCNLEAKNLLYENLGNGTFHENAAAFGLDLTAASMMAAFADYDCDGSLDLYLLTNRALHAGWSRTAEVLSGFRPGADTARPPVQMVPTEAQWQQIVRLTTSGQLTDASIPAELRDHYLAFAGRPYMTGQKDRLLRNVGGRFVEVSASAGIAGHGMGLSATWCDYDNDGYPDLYVANDLESPDRLYHNQQNGTFRNVTKDVLPHTAYYGMGSDWGDLDGDGAFDVLVADMSMTTHEKAKVLMGDMQNQRPILMHAEPPQYMRNALLLNSGLGTAGERRFREAGILAGVASTDWTWSVLFGDLDCDARLDIFATNGIGRFDMDPDMQTRVKELWAQRRVQAAIEVIQNVPRVAEKNVALQNTGDLAYGRRDDWGLDLEAVSHGAALCDLDGDGDLDVLVNNWNAPAAVYENTTSDGNAIVVALRGQHSERFGVGALVTARLADGTIIARQNWLSRGYLSGQNPELHFGLGKTEQVASLTVRWPSGHEQSFDNLACGTRYTITEPPTAPPPHVVEEPAPTLFTPVPAPAFTHRENDFDDYAEQPLLPERVSQLGPGIAFADVDGDGNEDMFVGGASGQAGELWLWSEDGWQRQAGPWDNDAAAEDLATLWLDHDGDGDPDLFVSSGGAKARGGSALLRDRLYDNLGAGQFARSATALPDIRESSGHAAAADFDRDGDLDLFVAGRLLGGAYPDAPSSRLYRNDGGKFVDVTTELAPALATAGMVTSALFTDVDGDTRLDLLLAAHWQPLRLLRNQNGKFVDATVAAGLSGHAGWWNSLCAIDVDRDGDLDYIAGNRGLNTKYKATAAKPARLYYGDFDDNGSRDLVEAKYEGDRLLPVRGRSCSSGAMPFVATKFESYQKFATATLADIYTPDKLAVCGEVAVTTLANSLLRNDGTGGFTIEPLPRRAQLAPIFGMVTIGELIVCGENSYAPEPETGRHDGGTGLVLRAGAGTLTVVPPHEHGICAFGDYKGLALRRRPDGRAEVLLARNSAALLAFAIDAGTPVPGPLAPGARITFDFADGSTQVAENYAGSGYLSQSNVVFRPSGTTGVQVRQ